MTPPRTVIAYVNPGLTRVRFFGACGEVTGGIDNATQARIWACMESVAFMGETIHVVRDAAWLDRLPGDNR